MVKGTRDVNLGGRRSSFHLLNSLWLKVSVNQIWKPKSQFTHMLFYDLLMTVKIALKTYIRPVTNYEMLLGLLVGFAQNTNRG